MDTMQQNYNSLVLSNIVKLYFKTNSKIDFAPKGEYLDIEQNPGELKALLECVLKDMLDELLNE